MFRLSDELLGGNLYNFAVVFFSLSLPGYDVLIQFNLMCTERAGKKQQTFESFVALIGERDFDVRIIINNFGTVRK